MPTEATVAHVLVSKYADHLPLYRQAQIYARQGINLDRSTLADWVGKAAFLLRPVHERLLEQAEGIGRSCSPTRPPPRCSIPAAVGPRPASCSPMRATTGPGAGRPARRRLRLRARPQGRATDRAISPASRGVLQVDGYAGYKALAEQRRREPRLLLEPCAPATSTSWPRPARRRSPARRSTRIAELYRIEDEIRGRSADERRAVRQQKSRPIVDALEPWLRDEARA